LMLRMSKNEPGVPISEQTGAQQEDEETALA
jgi:hypothetical protein